jgi:Family of unknown function (DUF6155)
MPITLKTLKTHLNALTEQELRDEVIALFTKLEQVKGHYTQELASGDDRKKMLETYKRKVAKQYWTNETDPRERINNVHIKKILTEFEKVSVFPHELADLLLYRVEEHTKYASAFGWLTDAETNPVVTSFKKAVRLIRTQKLETYFETRILRLLKTENAGWWYIESMNRIWHEDE